MRAASEETPCDSARGLEHSTLHEPSSCQCVRITTCCCSALPASARASSPAPPDVLTLEDVLLALRAYFPLTASLTAPRSALSGYFRSNSSASYRAFTLSPALLTACTRSAADSALSAPLGYAAS